MKYIVLLVFLTLSTLCFAQEGYHYISFRGGQTLSAQANERSTQLAVGFEFNSRYFNSWEIEFDAILRNEQNNLEAYLANIVYEPKIIRGKNSLLNFRFGGSVGSQQKDFTFGALAGLEYSYTLPGNFKLFLSTNTQLLVNVDQAFRNSLNIGFKIPF